MRSTLNDGGTGFCIAQERIFWVWNQADCQTADGTEEHPFCSLKDAITALPQESEFGIFLRGSPIPYQNIPFGGATYTSYLAVVGASTVLDEYPIFTVQAAAAPLLESPESKSIMLARVRITDSTFASGVPMVRCNGFGSGIGLDQVRIEGNTSPKGPLIHAPGCHIQIEESVITENKADEIFHCEDPNSGFWIANTFISKNVTVTAPVLSEGQTTMLYTTVAGNEGSYTSSVGCTGDGTLVAHNTLFLDSADTPLACTGDGSEVGSDNYVGLMSESDQFFSSTDAGVYRINPVKALAVGQWGNGYPYNDFELEPRPVKAGAVDFVGADEP